MGHNDHIDFELNDDIEELVDSLVLEVGTKEYGVAQQVIHQGHSSLTPKQQVVWDKGVFPLLKQLYEKREREHNQYLMNKD